MKCACSWTPVLAIVGLVGLGVGGYNMLRSGCPLGTCSETQTQAAMTPAAAITQSAPKDECPLHCSGQAATAAVQTVAHDTHHADACTSSEGCCKGKTEADCCKAKNDGKCPGTEEACGTGQVGAQCPHSAAPAKDTGAN